MDDWDWEEIADHTPEKFLCPQRLPECFTNSNPENMVEISREDGASMASSKVARDDNCTVDKPTIDSGEITDMVPSVKHVGNKVFSDHLLPGLSRLQLEDSDAHIMNRRGRGTFSYGSDDMYNDIVSKESAREDVLRSANEDDSEIRYSNYGTSHVLVFTNCLPSTKTTDLEKLVEKFGNGVVVRWVNDAVALAVFRSPANAIEAYNVISCPFVVRPLCEDDVLMYSIRRKDLEPPRKRPETSARVAKRLIAQGMGMKLSWPEDGAARGLRKKEEEERKNRIITRQVLRDHVWGE